jgi:hypothetical protein
MNAAEGSNIGLQLRIHLQLHLQFGADLTTLWDDLASAHNGTPSRICADRPTTLESIRRMFKCCVGMVRLRLDFWHDMSAVLRRPSQKGG